MQAVTRAAESPELTMCKAKAVDTGGPLTFVTGVRVRVR